MSSITRNDGSAITAYLKIELVVSVGLGPSSKIDNKLTQMSHESEIRRFFGIYAIHHYLFVVCIMLLAS